MSPWVLVLLTQVPGMVHIRAEVFMSGTLLGLIGFPKL
jgi:hypothetical protein